MRIEFSSRSNQYNHGQLLPLCQRVVRNRKNLASVDSDAVLHQSLALTAPWGYSNHTIHPGLSFAIVVIISCNILHYKYIHVYRSLPIYSQMTSNGTLPLIQDTSKGNYHESRTLTFQPTALPIFSLSSMKQSHLDKLEGHVPDSIDVFEGLKFVAIAFFLAFAW